MKIFCVGRNYSEHARELHNPVPDEPVVFIKPSTAYLHDNKPFFYPEFSKEIHFEVELVLKICRKGRSIEERYAHKYYEEISLGVDFTARDIQRVCKEKGLPWEKAKGFDHSAPVGRFVPLNRLPDRDNIRFVLHKNGEIVQKGESADMLFSFDRLISYISRYFTLHTGDLLFTGTPAGVGPIAIGDELEARLEGETLLHFTIK